jgi:hypothetical protein
MMTREPISIKHLVLQNGIFYMVVLLIAFGLKYHYSQARSDDLVWILGLHHLPRKRVKLFWLAIGMVSAYVLTILVNALRIISSIYFYNADIYCGWITPQRVHRLEGIVIYFFFLCLFYMIIKKGLCFVHGKLPARQKRIFHNHYRASDYYRRVRAVLIPLFWYVLITLGVPLLNAAYRGKTARFAEHGAMVVFGCLIVVGAVLLVQFGWRRVKNRGTSCT